MREPNDEAGERLWNYIEARRGTAFEPSSEHACDASDLAEIKELRPLADVLPTALHSAHFEGRRQEMAREQLLQAILMEGPTPLIADAVPVRGESPSAGKPDNSRLLKLWLLLITLLTIFLTGAVIWKMVEASRCTTKKVSQNAIALPSTRLKAVGLTAGSSNRTPKADACD